MSLVVILFLIIGLLFALTYFTRRRFGVLGLALCAGSLISVMWTAEVTPFVEGAGFILLVPPMSSVVAAILVLLPAVLLLFSGPTYHKKWQRLLGAVVFALMAASFLLSPLGSALKLDESGQSIYRILIDNRTIIVTLGIFYALYDILIMKTPKRER